MRVTLEQRVKALEDERDRRQIIHEYRNHVWRIVAGVIAAAGAMAYVVTSIFHP